MINSKQKGKRGELEWVKVLQAHGYTARRGQQYAGNPDAPDVVCEELPIHWEVKVREKLNVYDAIDQAVTDCPSGKWRCVAHKRNRGDWVISMPACDYFNLINEWREGIRGHG